MFVLAAVLGALAVLFAAMRGDGEVPARETIAYDGVLAQVREEYPYPVLAPVGLPDTWRAASVDRGSDEAGHRWRLGFLVENDGFVGLEQSDGEIVSFMADRLKEFDADGESVVDGTTWERRVQTTRPGDRALVLVDDGVVTIVRGTEPYDVLEEFAAALR